MGSRSTWLGSRIQILLLSLCRYKHAEEAEALFLLKKDEFPPIIKSWNIILNGWFMSREAWLMLKGFGTRSLHLSLSQTCSPMVHS